MLKEQISTVAWLCTAVTVWWNRAIIYSLGKVGDTQSGYWSEAWIEEELVKDLDNGTESIIMWINWRNDGFDETTLIENYLQWDDPENEREFFGMTCKKNRDYQGFLDIIDNFKFPSPSLKVSDDLYMGRISSSSLGSPGIFKQADPSESETEWAKAGKTRSICSAKAVMWSMTDGKPTDEILNERYYRLQENHKSTLSISSGYRA